MFKIQRNLLAEAVKRVSVALDPTNDPNNPGQYLLLGVNDGTLTLSVAKQDAASRLVIDKVDAAIYKADAFVKVALSGKKLGLIVDTYGSPDMLSVSLKPSCDPKPAQEGSTVMEVGKVDFKIKGVKKDEGFSMQCVDIDVVPSIDETGTDIVKVAASDLVKFGNAVGISAGKATHRSEYSNVLIKATGDKLLLVTVTQQGLAEAKIDRKIPGPDFSAIVPYDAFKSALKVLDISQDVAMIYNHADSSTGKAGTLVFDQEVFYGGSNIGKLLFRVTCSPDKFPKYEQKIGKADFDTYYAVVNTQRLKEVAAKMENPFIETVRTKVSFRPDDAVIDFKKSDQENTAESHIDIIESSKIPLDIILSSRHLKDAMSFAENDTTRICFNGGQASLVYVQCSMGLNIYMVPFPGE